MNDADRRGRQREEEIRGGRVGRRSDRGKGGSVEGQEPPVTLLQVVHCQEEDNTSNTGVRYIPDSLCTQHCPWLPHLPNKSFNVLSISWQVIRLGVSGKKGEDALHSSMQGVH